MAKRTMLIALLLILLGGSPIHADTPVRSWTGSFEGQGLYQRSPASSSAGEAVAKNTGSP